MLLQLFFDPATVSWIKVVGMLPTYLPTLPTHPTPPRTLPSWIIKANPSCG